MSDRSKRIYRSVSLQLALSGLLITVVLIVGCLIAGLSYRQSTQLTINASDALFQRIGQEMGLEINRLSAPIEQLVDLVSRQQLTDATTLEERMKRVPGLVEVLRHNPALSAFYVGYASGDFFLVRPLPKKENMPRNGSLLDNYDAPADAVYLVQSIEGGQGKARAGRFIYLSAHLKILKTVDRADYIYDPRTRPWYIQAIATDAQIKTKPYIFFTSRLPGLTFARRNRAGDSVVAANIDLSDLSNLLAQQSITPSAELVLVNKDALVIAYRRQELLVKPVARGTDLRFVTLPELGGELFSGLAAKLKEGVTGTHFPMLADEREWLGRLVPIAGAGEPVYLAVAAPRDELLVGALQIRRTGLIVTLLILLAAGPLAWLLARRLGQPLRQLSQEALAIARFDFSNSATVHSPIREIDALAVSMEESKSTMHRFMDIGAALSAEHDFDRLLQRIVSETVSIAHADVGVLYLLGDDRNALHPQLVKWAGADLHTELAALASVDLCAPGTDANPLLASLSQAKTVAHTLQANDAATVSWLGPIPSQLDAGRYMLAAIPLKNRHHEMIGAIVLVGPVRERDDCTHLFAFLEALSGTAAIAIENKQLLKEQKDLLESFIQVVAGSIDAKSPYTGGHCQRVPFLTKLLAQAACDAKDGPFRDFALSRDQWEEVHIGSWLHDCGKVTTPEYVVDKATKLETIYDRIHEIRMRFEVIKRDKEIECWKAIAGGGDRAALESDLAAQLRQLDEEYLFVASCNEGGEFMSDDRIKRVKAIAQRAWLRTLDDKVGISWEERQRKERISSTPLPVREMLLADRPDHCIERSPSETIAEDNPWGFKLQPPTLMFNRGEIYNLSVSRGTLTDEERYKINDHIVQTIIMLQRLPFPRRLCAVPEIAGGHHEKMDGSGYPKKLTRDEMSPMARMMAIADIFEALTAADRPYKKGKTLSESIRIMNCMKKDQHIDPDLFDLFLSSGIYLQYAQKYMLPEQIDAVDIHAYVASAS